eukprot:10641616-Heterocapsa_arctica.AAC.1
MGGRGLWRQAPSRPRIEPRRQDAVGTGRDAPVPSQNRSGRHSVLILRHAAGPRGGGGDGPAPARSSLGDRPRRRQRVRPALAM